MFLSVALPPSLLEKTQMNIAELKQKLIKNWKVAQIEPEHGDHWIAKLCKFFLTTEC